MCDVVEPLPQMYSKSAQEITFNEVLEAHEVTLKLHKADTISLSENLYSDDGETTVYCRHDPEEEWHVMELPKGKALYCPAGTELKCVTSVPIGRWY